MQQRSRQSLPPKKVRFSFLTAIAELLLISGFVALLFVVWQLYWTSFEVQGGIRAALDDFSEGATAEACEVEPEHRTDPPPTTEIPPAGEVFGVVHVPSWNNMRIPLGEGTEQPLLDKGFAGRYTSTQLPGEVGNFAIAAHRRSYGSNFRAIDTLQPGDQVVIETDEAWLVYTVTGHEIVLPSRSNVLLPVPNQPGKEATARTLTMTTCHPEYGNAERYIVYSEMDYWVSKADAACMPSVLGGK